MSLVQTFIERRDSLTILGLSCPAIQSLLPVNVKDLDLYIRKLIFFTQLIIYLKEIR